MDIATITCPTCGADADSLCFYDTEAFCMECGEVFDFAGEPQSADTGTVRKTSRENREAQ